MWGSFPEDNFIVIVYWCMGRDDVIGIYWRGAVRHPGGGGGEGGVVGDVDGGGHAGTAPHGVLGVRAL